MEKIEFNEKETKETVNNIVNNFYDLVDNAVSNNNLHCPNCYQKTLSILNSDSIDVVIQCKSCRGIWDARGVIASQTFVLNVLKEQK